MDKPGYQLGHVFGMAWYQDYRDEFVNDWDAVEAYIPRDRTSLEWFIHDLDALFELPDEDARSSALLKHGVWEPRGKGYLDPFLREVLARAEAGLEPGSPPPLTAPPGEAFHPSDERTGPYPELLNLAQYVDAYVSGEQQSPYLEHDPETAIDPVWVVRYRLSELNELYSQRLLEEIPRLRAAEPTKQGRLEAIGGTAIWDPAQDPDEFLDAVERMADWKVVKGMIPSQLEV